MRRRAKRGPKGAWKVEGRARDELLMTFKENASAASTKISDALFERTGVRVSSGRVGDLRAVWRKGSSMRPTPMVEHSRRVRVYQPSRPSTTGPLVS